MRGPTSGMRGRPRSGKSCWMSRAAQRRSHAVPRHRPASLCAGTEELVQNPLFFLGVFVAVVGAALLLAIAAADSAAS